MTLVYVAFEAKKQADGEWALLFAESAEMLSFQTLAKHNPERAQNPCSLVPRRELKT